MRQSGYHPRVSMDISTSRPGDIRFNSLVSSAYMCHLRTHSLDHWVTNTNKLYRHEVYMGDSNQPQVIQMRRIHQVVPLLPLYTEHHPLRPSSNIINFGLYLCLTNGHLVYHRLRALWVNSREFLSRAAGRRTLLLVTEAHENIGANFATTKPVAKLICGREINS